jgi:hypothetical protein
MRTSHFSFLSIRPLCAHLWSSTSGVMQVPIELTTKQGYDMSFGTNCLGHYYLTALLLPLLISTAAETGSPSRVVDVSSDGHNMNCGRGDKIIQYETLNDGEERRSKGSMQLYTQSKSVSGYIVCRPIRLDDRLMYCRGISWSLSITLASMPTRVSCLPPLTQVGPRSKLVLTGDSDTSVIYRTYSKRAHTSH